MPSEFGWTVHRLRPEDLEPAGDVDTPHQADTTDTGPTEAQRAHFRAAWAWITKNREPLLAAGWTPATLFRRAKYRWPSGPWGVAWLPVWDDLQVPIFKTGVALVATGAAALVLGKFLPKSRLSGRIALGAATAAADGYTAAPDSSAWIGKTGATLTPLHPAGTARIDGQRLDVVTSGEFIDAGTPVKIVEAHGNRLVVQKTGETVS